MDREQAKLILGAWRSGDAPEGDTLLEEALALMEGDPELAEWFAEQSATDEAMREALRTVEPPAHLRESIRAAAKVTAFPAKKASSPFRPVWLAIAAALVLAAGATFFLLPASGRMPLSALSAQVPALTRAHEHAFISEGGDLDAIRSWLARNGGASGFELPKGLIHSGGMECEIKSIDQVKVSILCFKTGDGHTAHLYIVDRAQLTDPPPSGAPDLRQEGAYATARWTQGDHSFILAQRGDTEKLRALF